MMVLMINAKDVDTAGGLLHVRVTEIYKAGNMNSFLLMHFVEWPS